MVHYLRAWAAEFETTCVADYQWETGYSQQRWCIQMLDPVHYTEDLVDPFSWRVIVTDPIFANDHDSRWAGARQAKNGLFLKMSTIELGGRPWSCSFNVECQNFSRGFIRLL